MRQVSMRAIAAHEENKAFKVEYVENTFTHGQVKVKLDSETAHAEQRYLHVRESA